MSKTPNPTTPSIPSTMPMAGEKLPWKKPALTAYGSVKSLTAGAGSEHPGDGGARKFTPCDRRLKQNILRVGRHPLGVDLYLFDYKEEFHDILPSERRLGVMADEVEQVCPEAVTLGWRGYKTVDYDLMARVAGLY